MTPKEEQLFWRGNYFPGTLSESELEEWARIRDANERQPTEEEQDFWAKWMVIFTLSVIGVLLVFL